MLEQETPRKVLALLAASVCLVLVVTILQGISNPAGSEAINIEGRKQLFLDDWIVESMEPRVYLLLNQPVKYADNPVIPLSGAIEQKGGLSHAGDGGNVFYDDELGLFRYFGWMVPWDWSEQWLFYAESRDGIHWVKPKLGQVTYLEEDTNFIAVPFEGERGNSNTVFKDPAPRNPEEKYKMIYHDQRDGQWGMYPAHSADGLHWKAYKVDRPIVPFYSDANNNLLWDAKQNRYLLYLRTTTRLDRWFKPEPIYPEGHRTRTPAWAASRDFLDWEAPQVKSDPDERFVSIHADERDLPGSRDFYTLEVLPYEDGFVGFTSVYHNMFGRAPAGIDSGKARSPWVDRVDVQLLWSRDGTRFQRIGDRRVFLPTGPEGSWDQDMIWTVQAPIVRENLGEIWIYYHGFGGHHWFAHRGEHQRGQIGLAILRLDGFVSMTGMGAFTTKALTFEGNRLTINATGVDRYAGEGYGTVRVEILDANTNEPIPGFGKDDFDVFGGDAVNHTVTWRGRSDVGQLLGRAVKLRFHLDRAKLFAFQFVQG